jgi:hypothetical protein
MTTSNLYHYKELNVNGSYKTPQTINIVNIGISNCDLSFIFPFLTDKAFIETFKANYDFITIPNKIILLIDELLTTHKLESLKIEFYLLVCAIQKEYLHYYEDQIDVNDSLSLDFQNMNPEVDKLLEVIHDYLKDENSVQSISIKLQESVSFNNLFVIRDILNAVKENYKITLDNFEIRKNEILENYTKQKLNMLHEKFKYDIIVGLCNYLHRGNISKSKISNESLRFVGSILHLSQVNINAKSPEIIFTDLKNLVSLSDISNLRNYLKRPERYFI